MLHKSPLNHMWCFIIAFEKSQGQKTLCRHKYIVKVGGGESKPHKTVSFLFLFMCFTVHTCFCAYEREHFRSLLCSPKLIISVWAPSYKVFLYNFHEQTLC